MGLFAIAEGFVQPQRGHQQGSWDGGTVEPLVLKNTAHSRVGLSAFLSLGFFWLGTCIPLSVSKCEMTGNTEVRVWQVNQGYGMKVHVPAGVDAPLQVETCFKQLLLRICKDIARMYNGCTVVAVIAVYLRSS